MELAMHDTLVSFSVDKTFQVGSRPLLWSLLVGIIGGNIVSLPGCLIGETIGDFLHVLINIWYYI
jgi:hypothetical protein